MYDIFFVSKSNSTNFQNLKSRYPQAQFVSDVKSFEDIRNRSFTKMFWIIWDDIVLEDSFDLNSYRATKWDDMYVHVFKNDEYYDGVCLFPKHIEISNREWQNRYFINKKEIDISISKPLKFEKHILNSYEQYQEILNSARDMFWGQWPDTEIIDESVLKLYFQHHNQYDRNENHVFKNVSQGIESFKNGLVLFSKNKPISRREFDQKYLVDKKEYDRIVTRSRYPIYVINTYQEYLRILDSSNEMFWCVWSNVDIVDETVFDLYYDANDGRYDHDRNENHVFLNACDDKISYLNGIVLFSKRTPITLREFERRYLINKKEHDIVASRFRYPKINLDSYETYKKFLEQTDSDLFWGVWPDNVDILDDSIFDLYFDPNDGRYDYDRHANHVFLNVCNDRQSFDLNGLILFSKHAIVSQQEFKRKHIIDKKKHDRLVSRFRYPQFEIDTYDEYEKIRSTVGSDMFWGIWPEVEVKDNTVFNLYFNPNDGKYDFDRNIHHVFLHHLRKDEYTYNGLVLFSKDLPLSKKEIDFRYIVDKKEHDTVVSNSRYQPYDIIFISFDEPNAEENWERLRLKFPRAKRVHGVLGIHNAHIEAAKLAETSMFYVVDGDAVIENDFNFDYNCYGREKITVYVWRSRNPINNLEYGYGGVKLLPRNLTISMNINTADMTTSISDQFKIMPEISNVTAFNTDPFNTWKSAFRECVKLSSKIIQGQVDDETEKRLNVWCNVGIKEAFGDQAILGARMGKAYGEKNKNNSIALSKINDFEWLKEIWENSQKNG